MPRLIARGQIAFTILDYGQEKATVRSRWIEINGTDSLVSTGTSGSYYTTKELTKQYLNLSGRIVLTFNDKILVFNGKALTFPGFGISELDTCYTILREFLISAGLGEDGEEFSKDFDWSAYSKVLTDYYDAEKRLNDAISKAIKSIADTANAALNAFLDGYQGTLTTIQLQIDKKAETWRQGADPALSWANEEKAKHVGDLWMDTSSRGGGKTYIYQNAGTEQTPDYQWVAQDIPTEVFDKIDGKAAIYTAWNAWIVNNVSQLRVKDVFIPASTTTQSGTTYYANRLYRCSNASTPAFVPLDYTNDSLLLSWGADDTISPVEKNGMINVLHEERQDYNSLLYRWNQFYSAIDPDDGRYDEQIDIWDAYAAAASEFFDDLDTIVDIDTWGDNIDITADVPYTPFNDVMATYYSAKEDAVNMLDDLDKSSYAYLIAALPVGADSDVSSGLILRNIIGVEDDAATPHVRAFINGIAGTNDQFKDATHGIVMFASGVPIPGTGENWDWTGAATKIFEDGTIDTKSIIASGGTIGGFEITSFDISSGSGPTHVALANLPARPGIPYVKMPCFWAGADTYSGAPFYLLRDGTLHTTMLYASGGTIGGFEISDHAIGVAPTLPSSGSARGAQLLQGEIRCYDYSRSAVKEVDINTDLDNASGPLLGISATGPYSGTAVSINAGNSTTVATALDIARGITKGLRPIVRTISQNTTLDDSDYTIIPSTSGLIITLPAYPQFGQTYQILCFGVGTTINGNGVSIKQCFGSGNTVTSFSPDYYGGCMLSYDGTYWYATKFKTS